MSKHPSTSPQARRKRRTSATVWSGRIKREGDVSLYPILERAIRAHGEFSRVTHGFHSHPARLHPEAARLLLEAFPGEGLVLDPFCGGGTVLLEAMLAGRPAKGSDLNPIAARIASTRTHLASGPELSALRKQLHLIASRTRQESENRRSPRVSDSVWALREWYHPQAMRELGWLRGLILDAPEDLRDILEMIHSSLVVKFSHRASETSQRRVETRYPTGAVCKLFEQRGAQLIDQLKALSKKVPPGTPPAQIDTSDARHLGEAQAELILTSPPYPSTYDYLPLQQLRAAWLDLDIRPLFQAELGARRSFRANPQDALQRWKHDTRAWMTAAARTLAPGGHLVIVIGDGVSGGRCLRTKEPSITTAKAQGLTLRTVVTVERRDQGAQIIRPEHILAFKKPA